MFDPTHAVNRRSSSHMVAERCEAVSEPPLRLIIAMVACGMMVGALLAPRPGADVGEIALTAQGGDRPLSAASILSIFDW